MKIGELARRTGVSTRSLRYYETRFLITSHRTAGGQREFTDDAVDRVLLTQQLFRAGLTSEDVVALLPCVFSGTTTPAMIALLRQQRARIQSQVDELMSTCDRLDLVLADAERRLVPA